MIDDDDLLYDEGDVDLYLGNPACDTSYAYCFDSGDGNELLIIVDDYDEMSGLQTLVEYCQETGEYSEIWGRAGDEKYNQCNPEQRVEIGNGLYVCGLEDVFESDNDSYNKYCDHGYYGDEDDGDVDDNLFRR